MNYSVLGSTLLTVILIAGGTALMLQSKQSKTITLSEMRMKSDPVAGSRFPSKLPDGRCFVVVLPSCLSCSKDALNQFSQELGKGVPVVTIEPEDPAETPLKPVLRLRGTPKILSYLNPVWEPRWYLFEGGNLIRVQQEPKELMSLEVFRQWRK